MRGAWDRGDRLRHRRSARADRPEDPAGAGRRAARPDGLPGGSRAAGAARGDRRLGRAPLRDDARPGHRDHPDARQQGGDLHLRARGRGRRRHPRHGRLHRSRLSGLRARRPLRARAPAGAAAARGARLPARPRRDRRRDVGAAGRLLDQLPEQPHRRDGAARVLRAARGAGARARLRARLRRGLHRALVRRAARVGAAARRPDERRRLQHALEAQLDDRLPQRLRGRRPGADRGAEGLPADRRDRAAGVRPARVGRRLGRRGARRRDARALRPQAGALPRPLRAARASASPAARRRCTSGRRFPTGETSEAFAERLLEHGVLVAPGSYLGAAGEGYFRVALVPSEEECGRAVEILERAL